MTKNYVESQKKWDSVGNEPEYVWGLLGDNRDRGIFRVSSDKGAVAPCEMLVFSYHHSFHFIAVRHAENN